MAKIGHVNAYIVRYGLPQCKENGANFEKILPLGQLFVRRLAPIPRFLARAVTGTSDSGWQPAAGWQSFAGKRIRSAMLDPTTNAPARESLFSLSTADLIARFAIGVEHFDPKVLKLSDAELDTAFRPELGIGRWPSRVLLGHLTDAELAFVHRMRRVVAEDGPVFSAWDEDAFIDSGLYGSASPGATADSSKFPVAAFVGVTHSLRRWTAEWLATLAETAFTRKAMHPQRGEQTLRIILEYDVWHLEHHAWYLNKKVAYFAKAGH